MSQTLVHLVYIHGFQGNDTTFQSFPKDLQQHLASLMPAHLKVQSSLYPTYKSIKPISYATRNFLDWLGTQPPGPVIVMGHSMGGLLAADAATDTYDKAQRIIGMVAFDTPYLGMHPHVVVSGIASLFQKDEEGHKKKPTEKDMNVNYVAMVDDAVTDDWAAYKKTLPNAYKSSTSLASQPTRPLSLPSSSQSSPPVSPGGSSMDPQYLVDRALSHPFISSSLKFFSSHTDDPLVLWAQKHSDAPFAAGKRWITEHFQFGSCMFDVPDLKQRYARLVAWEGFWVNYWTETVARKKEGGAGGGEESGDKVSEEGGAENDVTLLETGIADLSTSTPPAPPADIALEQHSDSPAPSTPTPSELKATQKAEAKAEKARLKEEKATEKAIKKAEKKGVVLPRHFIVLPTGLGRALGGSDKWEKVAIGGVQDEVAAHCGLFIRGQNLDYDGLVERVGARVLKWCETVR